MRRPVRASSRPGRPHGAQPRLVHCPAPRRPQAARARRIHRGPLPTSAIVKSALGDHVHCWLPRAGWLPPETPLLCCPQGSIPHETPGQENTHTHGDTRHGEVPQQPPQSPKAVGAPAAPQWLIETDSPPARRGRRGLTPSSVAARGPPARAAGSSSRGRQAPPARRARDAAARAAA
jgi:hypothetical protein